MLPKTTDLIDQITINYEENGILKVRELEKHVLSKGAWTTIMFLYEDFDPKDETYKDKKVSIRRYKKVQDEYKAQSKFNISSEKQALEIAEILSKWFAKP
ncbi:hypothetical protein IT568_00200 [bacterium]|nr:hypothetical protein [bacterium]